MRKEVRQYSWGEIDPNVGGLTLKWSAWNESHDTIGVGLGFCTIYIKIKKIIKRNNRSSLEQPSYGFNFFERGLHLSWGDKFKLVYLPWSWELYARWEQIQLNSWITNGTESPKYAWVRLPYYGFDHGNVATKYTSYYRHTLRNGELQSCVATYFVDKMEWRWKFLPFFPWPRKVKVCINVNFSEEMGKGVGSWKGGTIGCGYEMKKGEIPEETLRRMELEREL